MFDYTTLENASNYREVRRIRNYRIVYNYLTDNGYLDYIGQEYRDRKWFSIRSYKLEWNDSVYSPDYANKEVIKFANTLKSIICNDYYIL